MSTATAPIAGPLKLGIQLCRRGDWQNGLAYLERARYEMKGDGLPSLFFSYYGHALARCQRRHEEALALCERAIELEFYHVEHYVNLAGVHALRKDRKRALDAVKRGLAVEPANARLLALQGKLNEEAYPPVLAFLPREHVINRWLGKRRANAK
ncbi:MAG: hypothetical protein AAF533_30750 [Acidobacteriota bacterium]